MRAGICLEDLIGIRGRTTIAKAVRGDHWSFFQLRTFVEYKANIAGIPVAIVQPHYTSQTCSCRSCLGTCRGKHFACEA
jgi:IS605 OrfB family transposase